MSDNIIKKKEYKYDAFISYRHLYPDVDIAQKLHKLLETFKMPKELSKRIDWKSRSFIDREELTTGDLSSAIIEGLNNSRHLIVICSKRTKFSPWCIKEIETFRKIHGDDKVLALLVEGEPDEAFPDPVKQLKSRQKNEVIDAEYLNDTDDEPLSDTNAGEILAADVRPSKVKSPDFKGYEYLNREEIKELKKESLQILKQKEIYRIVAGMAGITYGDLKQRGRERRLKIILAIGTAAMTALSIFTTFMIMMYMRALKSERTAKQQTALMIQNYADKSIENGDKISALLIAKKAMEYASNKMDSIDYINAENYSILTRAVVNEPYSAFAEIDIGRESPQFAIVDSGKKLAVIGQEGDIEIWNIERGMFDKKLESDKFFVSVTGEENSDNVIGITIDRKIIKYNISNSSQEEIGSSSNSRYSETVLTKNSTCMIGFSTYTDKSFLDIWDIEKKEIVYNKKFDSNNKFVRAAHSNAGAHITYLLDDGSLTGIDLNTMEEKQIAPPVSAETSRFKNMVYNEKGDKLYYTLETKLYAVDLADSSNNKEYDLGFYAGSIRCSDGLLYIENRAGSKINITVLNADSGDTVAILRGKYGTLNNFSINPAQKEVVGSWSDGSISVWRDITFNTTADNEIYKYIKGIDSSVSARLKFSEDGKYLINSNIDGTISVVSTLGNTEYEEFSGELMAQSRNYRYALIKNGLELSIYDTLEKTETAELTMPEDFDIFYTIYAVSDDAGTIAVSNFKDLGVLFVDTQTKQVISESKAVDFIIDDFTMINDIKFAQDNKSAYITYSNGEFAKVDISDGKKIQDYEGADSSIDSIILSDDDKWLAINTSDRNTFIINAESGETVNKLNGEAYALDESSGRLEVIGTLNDDIFKWTKEDGEKITSTNNLRQGLLNRALNYNSISPDKKYMLTSISSGDTVLTDVTTGVFIKSFSGEKKSFGRAFFAGDSSSVIYTSANGVSRLEKLYNMEELEKKAENILRGRELSDEELEKIGKSK